MRKATQCRNGHQYIPENTGVWGGRRSCRTCDRERRLRRILADPGWDARRKRAAYSSEWERERTQRRRAYLQAIGANSTAAAYGLGDRIIAADVAALEQICAYCGATGDLTVDHVVPFSRGGRNVPENLTTACRSCNSRKSFRTGAEFRALLVA